MPSDSECNSFVECCDISVEETEEKEEEEEEEGEEGGGGGENDLEVVSCQITPYEGEPFVEESEIEASAVGDEETDLDSLNAAVLDVRYEGRRAVNACFLSLRLHFSIKRALSRQGRVSFAVYYKVLVFQVKM